VILLSAIFDKLSTWTAALQQLHGCSTLEDGAHQPAQQAVRPSR